MKEVTEEITVYEELKEKINRLNINDVLKGGLNNLNENIYKIKHYNLDFNINIVIDNCSKSNIEILLENITFMIDTYDIGKKIVKYSDFENISRREDSNVIIVIDDYYWLKNEEKLDSYKYYKFKSFISKNNNNLILTCEGDFKDMYTSIFDADIENVMNNSIFLHDEEMSIDELVVELKNMYIESGINCEIASDKLKNILLYFLNEKCCYNSNCVDYLYKNSIKSMLLKKKDSITVECFEKYLNNVNKEKVKRNNTLNDLIGLDNVKKEIESLRNYLEFKKKSKKDFDKPYLNMFFMGEPGTGKTTVARALADILYELGYLNNNNVVEIIPTDLMANYVGQTKDKTREILRKAEGGLLFIDEAYLICQAKSRQGYTSFMGEAVVELIKYLEDPKNVVVFAGYPDEMKKIYECNPGIKSRIYKEIYFDNYSSDELYFILAEELKEMGLKISVSAKNKILKLLNELRQNKGFGNARFCKQYAQKLVINHANKKLKKENFTISLDDVSDMRKNNKSRMGFVGGNNV